MKNSGIGMRSALQELSLGNVWAFNIDEGVEHYYYQYLDTRSV